MNKGMERHITKHHYQTCYMYKRITIFFPIAQTTLSCRVGVGRWGILHLRNGEQNRRVLPKGRALLLILRNGCWSGPVNCVAAPNKP